MATFTEKQQRTTNISGELTFMELSAPSFASVLRVVNDTKDWVSNGETYSAMPFRFTLPADTTGQSPRAQLEVNNVGRGITQDLENFNPSETVTCKLMLADRSKPDLIVRRFYLPLTNVKAADATITAQAGVDFFMRQQAVKLRATPFILPGIF